MKGQPPHNENKVNMGPMAYLDEEIASTSDELVAFKLQTQHTTFIARHKQTRTRRRQFEV
jgi:hypothetical protein